MNFTSKKTILFDLDGTITDSGEGIINSFKYTLKAYGVSDYDESSLGKYVGPPLKDAMKELFGFDDMKAVEAIEKYREYFRETGIFENRVYDGMDTLLKSLAADGKKLILATSKAEVFALRVLEHFDILRYFSGVYGSELNGIRTKKGEVIRYALDKAGIEDLSSTVMIGDREHDIIGAKAAGIDSIGVLYGYGSRLELENAGAAFIVETVEDLRKTLMG